MLRQIRGVVFGESGLIRGGPLYYAQLDRLDMIFSTLFQLVYLRQATY